VFLLEDVFLNKRQAKNKNQKYYINKNMKMRILRNVVLHRAVSSSRCSKGP
jgi:hypothetical protein